MSAIVSLLLIAAAVYILAVITDDFFVVSLDEVSKRLALPSDVAGASLMAMGSSAPELFIALVAVFRGGEHSDVGIGTIVGSAVFNILVITGLSAVIAGKMVMKRGAIERDIIFYLGSIAILLFVFFNGEILIFEALLMLGAYVGYLALLWYWSRTNPEDVVDERTVGGHHIKTEGPGPLTQLNNLVERVFKLIAGNPEKNYLWAMLISIAAIAGLSWVLVESAIVLSDALSLPSVIVALTVLAAGTSAPDLIASVDVARDGRGNMAVANAVGSNIFDILVGLGVPWVITLIFLGDEIHVGTDGLLESIFLLSVTTVILYIFLNTQRQLTRREGTLLLVTYVGYVIYVVLTS
jgi:K+-dependent Na+/Ca+ exchanger-like protein